MGYSITMNLASFLPNVIYFRKLDNGQTTLNGLVSFRKQVLTNTCVAVNFQINRRRIEKTYNFENTIQCRKFLCMIKIKEFFFDGREKIKIFIAKIGAKETYSNLSHIKNH